MLCSCIYRVHRAGIAFSAHMIDALISLALFLMLNRSLLRSHGRFKSILPEGLCGTRTRY